MHRSTTQLRARSTHLHRLIGIICPLCGLLAGCALSRIPVRQTFDRIAVSHGSGDRIVTLRARPLQSVDSTDPLLKREYLPVFVQAVVDATDSVRLVAVAGWQEYLSRYSERLRPVDKQYVLPIPTQFDWREDTVRITWEYPEVDSPDDDIDYAEKRRNSYWSIDVFQLNGQPGREHYAGELHSYPQYKWYDPLARLRSGGSYEQALPDSVAVIGELRRTVASMVHSGDLHDQR